jgi:hypothetical protein
MNQSEIIEKASEMIEDKGHVCLQDAFPELTHAEIEAVISRMESSGKWMLDKTPLNGKWVVRKKAGYTKKGFWARHPFYEKIAIVLIAALIGFALNLILARSKEQSQLLKELQQDSAIHAISDSLTILEKLIKK